MKNLHEMLTNAARATEEWPVTCTPQPDEETATDLDRDSKHAAECGWRAVEFYGEGAIDRAFDCADEARRIEGFWGDTTTWGPVVDALAAATGIADPVLVERMPEALRASHEAAGNAGVYPVNGAERFIAARADVEESPWTSIVRSVRAGDWSNYPVSFGGAS